MDKTRNDVKKWLIWLSLGILPNLNQESPVTDQSCHNDSVDP